MTTRTPHHWARGMTPPGRPMPLHWTEYAIEACLLGLFMVSACVFGTLLEHPASPVRAAIPSGGLRRALMGVAMGLTSIAIVYSAWGRRSGAHLNPAFTLAFYRLGRVARRDAVLYASAQFLGGAAGVLLAGLALGTALAAPTVHYVTTMPGPASNALLAFAAEILITGLLMTVVLNTAASARLARYTGVCAGLLVALYITLEAPISGMSLNPARSFASALGAGDWTVLWIYFTAPPIGMLTAAELHVRLRGRRRIPCAKMCHTQPCIFCEYAGPPAAP